MELFNGSGKKIAIGDNSSVNIVEHNLFDRLGGIYLNNHTLNAHTLATSTTHKIVYARLAAGNNYLFAFDTQTIIHVLNELPDVDTLLNTKKLTEWVYYGWIQNYYPEVKEQKGTYIITPEADLYILASINNENTMYIWDAEITGDIYPGASIGSSSFSVWTDTSYEAYPFKPFLEEYEDVETTEEFKKGVLQSTNINRIYNGNVPVFWVGDSIMYAGSNVGVDNCYRLNAAKALGLPWNYRAVSGTTLTDGYGSSWDNADNSKTGYSGFCATAEGASKAETEAEIIKQAKLVVLAMGTNDFGNNAPIGTVEDTGTDTFYGAFRAWLKYFQDYNPNIPIIVITPFKRDTWAKPNNQNLILPDYVRAMYKVSREFQHVYLLDVFSKWYGDTDNEVIRARNSIDGIHPSAWFHDCFTADLIQKIKEVCALEGIIG